MRFRPATRADVADVVALIESAYRGDASRAGWTTEADLLAGQRTDAEQLGALVVAPDSKLLLAEDGDELLGTVLVVDEGDAAYLGLFAVRPKLQAKGIGRALLAEAERVGGDVFGRSVARMTVLVQRPDLIAWYERRGYRRTGERRPFPYGDPRVGLPLRDDLVFDVLEKVL